MWSLCSEDIEIEYEEEGAEAGPPYGKLAGPSGQQVTPSFVLQPDDRPVMTRDGGMLLKVSGSSALGSQLRTIVRK